ncbi:M20/M25/M40 family metallo-hydrolase [Legionella tunisiensis]|uniref:M20/M25/M40 family metallo-hydrolase n=1 Tax=Legionella tunisiensis TaxID=1034944 RepID=UPI0002F1DEA3|nr:M20/M25/M40 family metallo-hydrolase [Legionella tunisiensis]
MKQFVLATLLTLSTLFIQPVKAKALSSTEAQISRYVLAQRENQLNLLEKLVNINSGTENITGIKQVGTSLVPLFTQLGFATQWINTPETMHRAGTLIAQHQGHTGNRLLLIGHLDTVFPINSPLQKFIRQGDIATGPGVIDDKGGVVVILYALEALHEAHALDDATITVILTGDEEDSGKPTSISRKTLIEAARHSDIALDFEWAFTDDTATVARRGISNWLLRTQGKEAHSSEIFWKNG